MTKPNKFIINTLFPTQKDEGAAFGGVFIPGSFSIPAGVTASANVRLDSGRVGSMSRGQIWSSRDPTNRYATQSLTFLRTGTLSGTPAPYQIVALIYRPSATEVAFQILVQNVYGSTLIAQAGDETIYFYSTQIRAPYA